MKRIKLSLLVGVLSVAMAVCVSCSEEQVVQSGESELVARAMGDGTNAQPRAEPVANAEAEALLAADGEDASKAAAAEPVQAEPTDARETTDTKVAVNTTSEEKASDSLQSMLSQKGDHPRHSVGISSHHVKVVRTPRQPSPRVASTAKTYRGTLLNRYYFLRAGDAPESVSKMIYGKKERAKDLLAWNGGRSQWRPGKILLYSSPVQPKQKEVVSFYQERNVIPEEYTIQPGDELQKLASQIYGHRKSWQEIAVVNGLKSSADIRVGQVINLYPFHLRVTEPERTVASVSAPEKKTPAEASQPAEAPVVAAKVETASPAPVTPVAIEEVKTGPTTAAADTAKTDNAPLVPEASTPKNPADLASLEIAKTGKEQPSLIAIISGGAAILLACFLLLRRSRRYRRPDFFE